jgi:hypothetical protein
VNVSSLVSFPFSRSFVFEKFCCREVLLSVLKVSIVVGIYSAYTATESAVPDCTWYLVRGTTRTWYQVLVL